MYYQKAYNITIRQQYYIANENRYVSPDQLNDNLNCTHRLFTCQLIMDNQVLAVLTLYILDSELNEDFYGEAMTISPDCFHGIMSASEFLKGKNLTRLGYVATNEIVVSDEVLNQVFPDYDQILVMLVKKAFEFSATELDSAFTMLAPIPFQHYKTHLNDYL